MLPTAGLAVGDGGTAGFAAAADTLGLAGTATGTGWGAASDGTEEVAAVGAFTAGFDGLLPTAGFATLAGGGTERLEDGSLSDDFAVGGGGGTTTGGTFAETLPAGAAVAFTGAAGLMASGVTFLPPRTSIAWAGASEFFAGDAPAGRRALGAAVGCFADSAGSARGASFFPEAAIPTAVFTGVAFTEAFTDATTVALGGAIGVPAGFAVAGAAGATFWTGCFTGSGGGTDFVDTTCF